MEHSAIIGACSSAGIIREDVLQETTVLNSINLHREGPSNMYGPLQKGLASVRVHVLGGARVKFSRASYLPCHSNSSAAVACIW
jgi:hypothetical protein